MTIAVYAGEKGGTGKTTTCLNHAVLLQEEVGDELLLVDTDAQGSLQDFVAVRNKRGRAAPLNCVVLAGKDIARQLRQLQTRYKHILVDCPGQNSLEMRLSVTVADLLITPCRPAKFDAATMTLVEQIVADAQLINEKLKAYLLINFASANRNYLKREERLRQFVAEYCPNFTILQNVAPNRIKFWDCADYGLAVHELPSPDPFATVETRAIFQELWTEERRT
jgi:chromosome partitioning protein